MKRFLTCLAATLLIGGALCTGAAASDFDSVAEDLSAIGMFRGTAAGFELDRAPTRSEAAIMLVRLYGAEEEAKAAYDAGEIRCPFTDVSDFTAPYVAWLYENGIANGISATTFGSGQACSAKMYCAFLLRALGYQDGTDFAYADALIFAQEKGFYEPLLFSGDFLRDDLAALTYQALAADTKDGETYLLDSLIQSGAIDAQAAAPMTEKIEAYRALAAAQLDSQAMDANIDMDMYMHMVMDGVEMVIPSTTATGQIQMRYADGDVELAYTMDTTAMDTDVNVGMWMKDGWVYFSTAGGGESFQYKYEAADQMAALESLGTVNTDMMNVASLALVESISAEKSGSDTVYTMTIGENLGGMLDAVTGLLEQDPSAKMEIGSITARYTVDRNGVPKEVQMGFSVSMQMDVLQEDGTVSSVAADYDYDMTMTINAVGDDVEVTFPDFSGFQEVDPSTLSV